MADDERQIRAAAETLLTGSINSQRSSYTHHSITRTPDFILSEDLIAGVMQNGRMSNIRRFFCLFVTFDLLLTFLMWLICTMIAGESLESAFMNQVVHYHIKTSLFDIVMAAICRFTVLLLFYALLRLDHWIIVASTTATTCAFSIAKVFLFDWSVCTQPVFQVLLILTSFVLSWVEAWFFDIRVLPQETQARNWIRHFGGNEREPLLRGVTSETRQYTSVEPPAGTFFTPMDSPDHSDQENESSRRIGSSRGLPKGGEPFGSKPLPKLTPEMIEDYKRRANVLVQDCHDLLQSKDWQIESILSNGDIIFYVDRPKEGRILKIVGIIDAPASILADQLFNDIEGLPSWNKLVSESKKLQHIDENTDIIYQATNPHGGGIIGARDFVILRHRTQYGNYYISSGTSVPFPLPQRSNFVRAENTISCWASEEILNEENKCRFTWINNTNLKGWVPQKIVDKSMSTALVDFMSYVRKYVDDMQRSFI
ncbi:steroidogenic acute regulatory protein-like [Megachile rotundata]|uniref:steroidogenic acute regulatory protein-like n=1 Tax=Megachile rotundata TaxID=143995 RepID=UPI000258EA35|nr:PREDICTED: stAR-related lipid transfer protein 3 [Megachile rotundata]